MKKLFVAMPINKDKPELEDVLKAIKEAAKENDFDAFRIDEEETNEKITDRIIDHIKTADYIVADLTHLRPNVFYEAGFAHAQGKNLTFIAKEGTELSFDIKDYPVIDFRSNIELKNKLSKRIQSVVKNSTNTPPMISESQKQTTIFSEVEEKEFWYIYEKFNKTYTFTDVKQDTKSKEIYKLTVSDLYVVTGLDKHLSDKNLTMDCYVLMEFGHDFTFQNEFNSYKFEEITEAMRKYGLVKEVTNSHIEYGSETFSTLSDKMYRFKYWLEVKKLLPQEPKTADLEKEIQERTFSPPTTPEDDLPF